MPTSPYGRFVILIDGNNFYHTLRDLNLHIDYRKFLAHWQTGGTLVRAHYFTALLAAPLTPVWLVRLLDWLSYNGFMVHTKPAKVFNRIIHNEQGERSYLQEVKSGVEMEIVVEAMSASRYCDTIVICSGSGELISMVKAVQQAGCRVVIVSSDRMRESTVATDLVRQADEFVELDTLRSLVAAPVRA
jgi:uncharacterized LabA/DUF88 family protein